MIVYKSIDGEYNHNFPGIEYFAINQEYAGLFGVDHYEFKLDTNCNILDLEKWNKIYTEKTHINGNRFNNHQGLFVIGSIAITNNYADELAIFIKSLGEKMADIFLTEFNGCDIIYGEEAGYPEYVYAVKNKNLLTFLGKHTN